MCVYFNNTPNTHFLLYLWGSFSGLNTGIDAGSLVSGVDFGRLGNRLNEQIEKFPLALFK